MTRALGYWATTAIGVGGMVGGGIFAVLGLAVQLARGGTPVAFAVAGAIALVTSYSYAKLAVRYRSQGGTVIFLDEAFGVDMLTGVLNSLLWLSYIVMLALYAYAFGSYGATFFPEAIRPVARHGLISAAVLIPGLLNVLNASVIGRAETYVVAFKLAILLLFIAIGAQGIDTRPLEPSRWAPAGQLVAGGMIIFVAYEGFELIANAAEDVRDPGVIPRALYSAVTFVLLLYVLIAAVAVGSLPIAKIVAAKDYALAAAASPFLGRTGFVLISIAALLSTLSAINATLYGTARLSYTIAREGELPAFLEHKVWNKPLEGLFITVAVALILANLADLSNISTMGSAGFLLIFGAVNASNFALRAETGSRGWLSGLGVVGCAAALAALVWNAFRTAPASLGVLGAMLGLAVAVELFYRLAVRRAPPLRRGRPPTR